MYILYFREFLVFIFNQLYCKLIDSYKYNLSDGRVNGTHPVCTEIQFKLKLVHSPELEKESSENIICIEILGIHANVMFGYHLCFIF